MQQIFIRASTWVLLLVWALPGLTQPVVVATAEGQVGTTPGVGDEILGARVVPLRGEVGKILLGGLFMVGDMPPSPEFSFLTDRLNQVSSANLISTTMPTFERVFGLPPAVARSRNAANDNDFVAFGFASDGSLTDTLSVAVATFDEDGQMRALANIDNIPTFVPPIPGFPPDPSFADTGIAVDNQGRVTVVYTGLAMTSSPRVQAQRLGAVTGQLLGSTLDFADPRALPDIALLDPAGDRLLIASTDFANARIVGNILDTTGMAPAALPEFPISTTTGDSGFASNINAAVAADPNSGMAVVVWEHFPPGVPASDPVNIRGRRFDATGNPIGGDFRVNSVSAGSQGQPAVAVGLDGRMAIAWSGEAANFAQDNLDIFMRVFDSMGQPIGDDVQVNTTSAGRQDRPDVRFLPDPDANGRPQFVVVWRDVGETGDVPNGTGTGYRCFSIDDMPPEIFADGFESGDTTSWCASQSNP